MFEGLKARLARLRNAPGEALRTAAPLVAEKLRADATTRRGNVPSYGAMGDVPIAVSVRANSLDVTAAGWVIEKAQEKGQPEEWAEIVREQGRRALKGE